MFPTKKGMLHSSQAESSTKVSKNSNSDPDSNPEPDKDIIMDNNEDSDDNDNCDYPDIVSTKWPDVYFKGYDRRSFIPMDLNATYTKPHIDQVLLCTSVEDIFANSNTTIDITELKNKTNLKFNPVKNLKKWQWKVCFNKFRKKKLVIK